MTMQAGGWNRGKWGSTLAWGYQFASIAALASVHDDAIVSAMANPDQTGLSYAAVVTCGGTDISDGVIRGEIRLNGQGGHSICELELVDPAVVPTDLVSEIIVAIQITIPTGEYLVERFRGIARETTPQDQPSGRGYSVLAYGAGYQLAIDKPSQVFGYQYFLMSAGAREIIDDMLLFSGLSGIVGTWNDYTPRLFYPSQFQSNLEAVQSLIQGLTAAQTYIMPSGLVRVSTIDDPIISSFSFPLACQSRQEPGAAPSDAFNRATFTGAAVYHPAYNDSSKQSTQGIIQRAIPANYVTLAAQIPVLGKANVDWSQKQIYRWETQLNPYIAPGETAALTLKDGTVKQVQITACIDTFEVGSFHSSWEGRA